MVTGLAGREVALVMLAHAEPALTRAEAARRLGIGTGAATELVSRLAAAKLLAERPAPPSGSRGRPTTVLIPHPDGPIVAAVAITQEAWRLQAVQLGGGVLATAGAPHDGTPAVLGVIADALRRLRRRFNGRVRGVGVSAPGIVRAGVLLDAANLGWRAVQLRPVWPRAALFIADNDATLAALGESRRGVAVGAALHLHLRVEAGLGGALIDNGVEVTGAGGVGGEFGHMPMGEPGVRCNCGATGCWSTAVDGAALAAALGLAVPPDPVSFGRAVLSRAAAGEEAAGRAADVVATALGRGMAGLANALDPDLITLGGLAVPLHAVAGTALDSAYRAGLMAFRRSAAPRVLAGQLGEDGPLVGAAERVWSELWNEL